MIASTYQPLPRWAADILGSPPSRGDGLNRWLLRAALALRRCGRDERDIVHALAAATAGEAIRGDEIERAAKRSGEFVSAEGDYRATLKTSAKWPAFDATERHRVVSAIGLGATDLWEASPYRLLDSGPDAEAVIDLLFPGDPLLCCARKLNEARTHLRSTWRGHLGRMPFIVPSPMIAPFGRTQQGRPSARSLSNTGPRHYLVVEQDRGSIEEQAAVLIHLAGQAPLVLCVFSGSKSIHAWFSCRGASEVVQKRFFAAAVRLGADPATWTRCQLVRMPEGRRDNGNRQSLLYLNQEVL